MYIFRTVAQCDTVDQASGTKNWCLLSTRWVTCGIMCRAVITYVLSVYNGSPSLLFVPDSGSTVVSKQLPIQQAAR